MWLATSVWRTTSVGRRGARPDVLLLVSQAMRAAADRGGGRRSPQALPAPIVVLCDRVGGKEARSLLASGVVRAGAQRARPTARWRRRSELSMPDRCASRAATRATSNAPVSPPGRSR